MGRTLLWFVVSLVHFQAIAQGNLLDQIQKQVEKQLKGASQPVDPAAHIGRTRITPGPIEFDRRDDFSSRIDKGTLERDTADIRASADGPLLIVHPFRDRAAIVERTVAVTGRRAALHIAVRGHPSGDFLARLILRPEGGASETILERTVAGANGWQIENVDISRFQGRRLTVRFEAHATGWSFEYAALGRLSFDGASPVQVQTGMATTGVSRTAEGAPPVATPSPREALPTRFSGRVMLARCKDETRQGQLGPYREQRAVIWALVGPDAVSSFERAPPSAPDLRLSGPVLSPAAAVLREALQLAAVRCGFVVPRDSKVAGAAAVQVALFRDRLPGGGPIRTDEREANVRTEDGHRVAATVVTSDGEKFGFGNHSDDMTRSQQRQSDAARSRAEAAKIEEAAEERRMKEFFARHGVSGLADERELQDNPFSFKGKTIVVPARFVQMLSPSRAVMNMPRARYLVVDGVPADAIKRNNDYIVVGKVLGNMNFDGNSFGTPAPHVQFVAIQRCKKYPFEGCY